MTMTTKFSLALALCVALPISCAWSAQLRVEPVLLDLTAPAAAATLTLRNDEDEEATIQTRVMRWSQIDGVESLEAATDVVASPPSVKLAPRADYVVRVVRVAKTPVRGEESYRVLVDQLPRTNAKQTRAVNLLIRQSIPVFFRARDVTDARVSWSLKTVSGKPHIVASNAGDERLRIANLRLKDAAGATVSFGNGLIGYVLGRSSMSWPLPKAPPGFGTRGSLSVTAETNKGSISAVADSLVRQ
jgi:fimbrial chaperone protein